MEKRGRRRSGKEEEEDHLRTTGVIRVLNRKRLGLYRSCLLKYSVHFK